MYNLITYTVLGKTTTKRTDGEIEFHYADGSYIIFAAGGHRYSIDCQYVVSIKPLED